LGKTLPIDSFPVRDHPLVGIATVTEITSSK
jgi:hypothetical protein